MNGNPGHYQYNGPNTMSSDMQLSFNQPSSSNSTQPNRPSHKRPKLNRARGTHSTPHALPSKPQAMSSSAPNPQSMEASNSSPMINMGRKLPSKPVHKSNPNHSRNNTMILNHPANYSKSHHGTHVRGRGQMRGYGRGRGTGRDIARPSPATEDHQPNEGLAKTRGQVAPPVRIQRPQPGKQVTKRPAVKAPPPYVNPGKRKLRDAEGPLDAQSAATGIPPPGPAAHQPANVKHEESFAELLSALNPAISPNIPPRPTPPSSHPPPLPALSVWPVSIIKRERSSSPAPNLNPVQPQTSGAHRVILPPECQRTNPSWQIARKNWGLQIVRVWGRKNQDTKKVKKWFIREDGLVIEWELVADLNMASKPVLPATPKVNIPQIVPTGPRSVLLPTGPCSVLRTTASKDTIQTSPSHSAIAPRPRPEQHISPRANTTVQATRSVAPLPPRPAFAAFYPLGSPTSGNMIIKPPQSSSSKHSHALPAKPVLSAQPGSRPSSSSITPFSNTTVPTTRPQSHPTPLPHPLPPIPTLRMQPQQQPIPSHISCSNPYQKQLVIEFVHRFIESFNHSSSLATCFAETAMASVSSLTSRMVTKESAIGTKDVDRLMAVLRGKFGPLGLEGAIAYDLLHLSGGKVLVTLHCGRASFAFIMESDPLLIRSLQATLRTAP